MENNPSNINLYISPELLSSIIRFFSIFDI